MKLNKILVSLALISVMALLITGAVGCKKSSDNEIEEPDTPTVKASYDKAETPEYSKEKETIADSKAAMPKEVILCGKCGNIKGSAACCDPKAVRCEKCGLIKGSIGCCKIPKGAGDVAICTKCGHIKGSAACCDPKAVRCPKCGLAKGSIGCCKLNAITEAIEKAEGAVKETMEKADEAATDAMKKATDALKN